MTEDPRIYLRIAGEVRTRIEAGEFDSEGKIPSVRTLMQDYGVAYDTAQHAAADRDKVIAAALSELAAGTVTPITAARSRKSPSAM